MSQIRRSRYRGLQMQQRTQILMTAATTATQDSTGFMGGLALRCPRASASPQIIDKLIAIMRAVFATAFTGRSWHGSFLVGTPRPQRCAFLAVTVLAFALPFFALFFPSPGKLFAEESRQP